jgi:two-component system, LytTR family, sensor kinase
MRNGLASVSSSRSAQFWLLQAAGWGSYGIAMFLAALQGFPTAWLAFAHKGIFVTFGFLISLVLRTVYRPLGRRGLSFPALAATAIAVSYAFGLIWAACYNFTRWSLLGNVELARVPWFAYFHEGLNFTFVFVAWSALYFGIKYYQDLQAQKERSLEAQALATQAQLQMLRYQLNPHFLFNALNSIHALVRANPDGAEQMIAELSEFLRYSLKQDVGREVPLRAELEAVQNYLTLEKIRFEEKLQATVEADTAAMCWKVPGFLLHPLVENAVKYGMQTTRLPLQLRVKAVACDGVLHLEVANTGRWDPAETRRYELASGHGIGIENVRQRLDHAFPGRHQFDVSESEGWVTAHIRIEAAPVPEAV